MNKLFNLPFDERESFFKMGFNPIIICKAWDEKVMSARYLHLNRTDLL